jgi:hypothetical protein
MTLNDILVNVFNLLLDVLSKSIHKNGNVKMWYRHAILLKLPTGSFPDIQSMSFLLWRNVPRAQLQVYRIEPHPSTPSFCLVFGNDPVQWDLHWRFLRWHLIHPNLTSQATLVHTHTHTHAHSTTTLSNLSLFSSILASRLGQLTTTPLLLQAPFMTRSNSRLPVSISLWFRNVCKTIHPVNRKFWEVSTKSFQHYF